MAVSHPICGYLIGLAFYLGLAGIILISGVRTGRLLNQAEARLSGPISSVACGLGFCGLAMLPAAFFSLQRMRGKPIRPFQTRPIKVWQGIALGAGWIGAVLLSDFLYQNFIVGLAGRRSFLCYFHRFTAGPAGLDRTGRHSTWIAKPILGKPGYRDDVGPFLASLLELFVYLGVLLVLLFVLAFNPNWLATIQQLISQLQGVTSIEEVMQILAPYLVNPFILVSLFLVLGVFTPLIEETVKPAVVWLLAKRLQSPAQGFALGVISGAGFALVESLLASSTPGQGWGELLAARQAAD